MTPSSLTEFHDSKSIPSLELHLTQWICVLKAYREKVGDSPFAYRERTQVGFFAAASWLLGVPALEEWSTEKGTEESPSKGRCDLWIMTEDFHIEAKHAWCDVSRKTQNEEQHIKKTIEESLNSARWLSCDSKHKLAFTFLSPCISNEEQSNIQNLTSQWLSLVCSISFDAIAWYLPERPGTPRFEYPFLAIGSVLLIHKP